MNIFQVSLSRLQTLYSFSKKISIIDSAKRASTQRTIALEKMLEKILLHDHSILVLLSVVPKQIQEFDVSLIASAARNIMETANIYFHISQRGIDTDTIKFRVETMALNEIYNEIDITKNLASHRIVFMRKSIIFITIAHRIDFRSFPNSRNSQQMSRPTYYLVGNQLFK